jgi:tetratricopeptide (TPR) repeat protein
MVDDHATMPMARPPAPPNLQSVFPPATGSFEPLAQDEDVAAEPREPASDRRRGWPALVDAILVACRTDTLDDWIRRHPARARRLLGPLMPRLLGSAGENADGRLPAWALGVLVRWTLSRLRPDRADGLDGIEPVSWLHRTSWRPLLAVACQHGILEIPELPGRRRPRPGTAASDALADLWSVGPSTVYRYLDKGKRQLADLLREWRPDGAQWLALRALVRDETWRRLGLHDEAARQRWHLAQAATAASRQDGPGALWHRLQARDLEGLLEDTRSLRQPLADAPETDALLAAAAVLDERPGPQFALWLERAALSGMRHQEGREREALEHALRLAGRAADPLMLGRAYGALGKFHEARDPDRAFACYADSVECLQRAGGADPARGGPAVVEELMSTLVKLAWLQVLRNDPRSRGLLERADELRAHLPLRAEALGQLEQTWGEYWRRAGDLRRALEHKHRALNIYERLGDLRSVIKTDVNLALLYTDAKEHDRAEERLLRVLELSRRHTLEPEMLASAHMNLGVTYYWMERWDDALREYRAALGVAEAASLRLHQRRAHYNLAEAHYQRLRLLGDAEDERLGDLHAAAALKAQPGEADPQHTQATLGLKAEILGQSDARSFDRLMPGEVAAHFAEMNEVQRQRAVLAVPLDPQAHVRAHLAIARAYLAIAQREREAAAALVARHALGDAHRAEFDALQDTFNRQLDRAQVLAGPWRERAADLLGDERRGVLLQHLVQEGHVTKRQYGSLCDVSPATASKHLVTLAERGLLVQTGRGPATRYLLPAAS